MQSFAKISAAFAAGASALHLTPENYDEATAGKAVFIKFYAPWCSHCKEMAPAWEKLTEEFKDSTTILVAEVDCTGDARPLCEANGVKDIPSLKLGYPSELQDYEGARDFESLKDLAGSFKAPCSPTTVDSCDETERANIEEFMALAEEELDAKIQEKNDALKASQDNFDAELKKLSDEAEKLNEVYQKLIAEKDAAQKAVKDSGLALLKSVRAQKAKAQEEDQAENDTKEAQKEL